MLSSNETPGIFVRTFTKRRINLLAIEVGDIQIEDIAHHLSLQNRFLGATPTAYSTAQHSVYVATMVARWGASTVTTLQALLHDAEEAYLGDIISPIKRDPRAAPMAELGEYLRGDVLTSFGLPRAMPYDIKLADSMVCAMEVRDLMGEDPEAWGLPPVPAGGARIGLPVIHPWPTKLAEQRFKAEFNRLNNAFHYQLQIQKEQAHAPV